MLSEDNVEWLSKIGLLNFARIKWDVLKQNQMVAVYLRQFQLNDGQIFCEIPKNQVS